MSTLAAHVTITCPPWCSVTEAEHATDLQSWEGRCIHSSDDATFKAVDRDTPVVVYLAAVTWFDGVPDEEEDTPTVSINQTLLRLDEAERLALEILKQVGEARR